MVDVSKLSTFLPHINAEGHSVNVEQRTRLESAEKILLSNYKLAKISLFGRVTGEKADYLVCLGYKAYDLLTPARCFYSHNGSDWALLPEIDEAKLKLCQKINTYFIGDPGYINEVPVETVIPETEQSTENLPTERESRKPADKKKKKKQHRDDDTSSLSSRSSSDVTDLDKEDSISKNKDAMSVSSEEGEEDPAREPRLNVEIKEVTEEVRLAALVKTILSETALAPRGALQLTPKLEVVQNCTFTGLPDSVAAQQSSYLHARPSKVVRTEVDTLLNNLDFLDPISADTPNDTWSIRTDASDGVVSVRNLQWLGSFFFYVKGTNQYAWAYFGSGVKNSDFAFMV